MATFHLNCAKAVIDGIEVGQLFQGTLTQTVDELDDTAFCDEFISRTGGLEATALSGSYHYDPQVNDAPLWDRLGTSDSDVLVVPKVSDGVGAVSYQFVGMHPEITGPEGDTSSLAGGSFSVLGTSLAVRSRLLEDGQTARTATFDGAGFEVGAVTSAQKLYATLHVTSASASDTLDVLVESDVDNTFATPATVATFTQATAVGAQRIVVDGPLTDTWFRVAVTIAGTDPSFKFYVTVGVR